MYKPHVTTEPVRILERQHWRGCNIRHNSLHCTLPIIWDTLVFLDSSQKVTESYFAKTFNALTQKYAFSNIDTNDEL